MTGTLLLLYVPWPFNFVILCSHGHSNKKELQNYIFSKWCLLLRKTFWFQAPLYWDIYATRGFNSARICFTCHNFEYQGVTSASELASCGLDVHHLHRPDRMQDNSAHDKVNPIKVLLYWIVCFLLDVSAVLEVSIFLFQGAIVYSNIVTTVSPTYAQEVRTTEVIITFLLDCYLQYSSVEQDYSFWYVTFYSWCFTLILHLDNIMHKVVTSRHNGWPHFVYYDLSVATFLTPRFHFVSRVAVDCKKHWISIRGNLLEFLTELIQMHGILLQTCF